MVVFRSNGVKGNEPAGRMVGHRTAVRLMRPMGQDALSVAKSLVLGVVGVLGVVYHLGSWTDVS